MSPFQLSSIFDAPIYEISSIDLLNFDKSSTSLPRFLFLVKITEHQSSKQAQIFIQNLVAAFGISPDSYQIICCNNLPNNLQHFLKLGGKAVCFGFHGAFENMLFTYSFSELKNLHPRQKQEIWAALKFFVEL